MKARVKATGEIVEVYPCDTRFRKCSNMSVSWFEDELDFFESRACTPDYWTHLEHQYAGMAMQGLLSNERCWEENADKIAEVAICYAKELVKGLRIERSN